MLVYWRKACTIVQISISRFHRAVLQYFTGSVKWHYMLPDSVEEISSSTVDYLQMPPKGAIVPYDPENFDESFSPEYGGYTFSDSAGGGGRGGGRGGPRFVTCFVCTL